MREVVLPRVVLVLVHGPVAQTHLRATYKCAEGPPGSKWNLAADTPPLKRVGRRAYKRAREELAMLEREARPKQKPVKTL